MYYRNNDYPFSGGVSAHKDNIEVHELTLTPVKAIHRKSDRGEFFTLVFSDGTKTTVKLRDGDESDSYLAFLYCMGKRIFGDKGNGRRYVQSLEKVFEDEVAEKQRQKKERVAVQNRIKQYKEMDREIDDEVYMRRCLFLPLYSQELCLERTDKEAIHESSRKV